ncbi:acetate uptake transporter family protein [Jatrophihabitans sp. GAS493]|uniref:acetate uptake transporter n=1 Tax=Jatrophihabitans sp. GAS493 TaxID=1907575 RepID=UPI000BB987BA|nr:acetate uptake transporter family protein [Jatrophihabitans sp. GAS493]
MTSMPAMAPAIADPGPLGLAGFAMTTFMLSVFNTNMVSATLTAGVLGVALFYGGAVQLLAGMWEFRNGNTFGALAFSSFGAFWLAYWYYVDHVAAKLPVTEVHKATGLFLLSWAIFTAYMTIASLRTTVAIAAVFVALTVTFVLLTIGAFGDHLSMTKAGGWAGLVTAALAWYASFAGVTNATFKRTILPTHPLS